jgi:membrane-associated HD superfamily phosphohydrolase
MSSSISSDDLNPRAAAKNFLTLRNGGIALLYLVTLFLISPPPRLSRVAVQEGKPQSKNILAQVDFEVIDEEATRLAKERAASLEPPVYVIDPDILLSSISNAEKQFDKIRQDILNPLFSQEERIALLSKYLHSSTSESTLTLLAGLDQEGFDRLRSASLNALEATESKGILSGVPGSAKEISVYDKTAHKWRMEEVNDVMTLEKAASGLRKKAREKFPDSPAFQNAMVELVTPFLSGTLRFDEMLTDEAKNEVIKSTPPVMRVIKKNGLIIGAGQDVTHQDILELKAHARALGKANLINMKRYIGNALLLLMVFGCFLFYLKRYLPEVLRNTKSLLLIAIMVLMTLVTSWLFIVFSLPTAWLYVVPVAAGAILLSILANDRMALVYSFFISVLYASQGNYKLSLFLLGIFGSLAEATSYVPA